MAQWVKVMASYVTKVQWANNQPFDYAIITIDNDTGITLSNNESLQIKSQE